MLSTIEQFPRGAALQVVRTPRSSMESVRLPSLPQPQVTDSEQELVGQSSHMDKLVASDSAVTAFSRSNSSSNSSDEGSGADCVSTGDSALATVADSDEEAEAIAAADELVKYNEGLELVRRSQRRVSDWKRSEQERREEEERMRQERIEEEQRRKSHAARLKQRRRAEIYALNALLRTLQQEKMALYISAQKKLAQEREKQNCGSDTLSTKVSSGVRPKAIGV